MGAMGAVATDFAVKSVFLCMLARRTAYKGAFTNEYRESRHWRAAIDRCRRFRAALTAGALEGGSSAIRFVLPLMRSDYHRQGA